MTDETTGATAPAETTTAPAVEDGKPAVAQEATVETTEAKPEGEAETTEENTEEAESDKPKRLPRSQRDKRKISYLAGENARLAQEIAELRTLAERAPKADAEPTLEQFNYDVDKFNDAKSRWNIRQEISSLKTELQRDQLTERQARLAQNRVRELQERADAIKDRVPDFDRVLKDFADDGGQFSEHVKEAVIRVGPELAYYLAKNPDIAEELNELEPIEAAIRIGELRPKLSLAQPRKQTQAPAPLKGITGGAAPTKSLADLAKADDLSAYIKARDAEDAAAKRR